MNIVGISFIFNFTNIGNDFITCNYLTKYLIFWILLVASSSLVFRSKRSANKLAFFRCTTLVFVSLAQETTQNPALGWFETRAKAGNQAKSCARVQILPLTSR